MEPEGATTIMLIGEGTFHQVHGGVATNSLAPPHKRWSEEYLAIRGETFSAPRTDALYFGRASSLDLIARSVDLRRALDERAP